MHVCVLSCFSHVQLFVTQWTIACQTPLSMGFSRQEYWSGLPFPPPGDLPNPGIEPVSPALEGGFFSTEPPGKPIHDIDQSICSQPAFLTCGLHIPGYRGLLVFTVLCHQQRWVFFLLLFFCLDSNLGRGS